MKILILGGGYQQLPAIRKAKEMGLETVVADYLEHPPGREEADILIKPVDSSGSKVGTVLRNSDRIKILETYQKAKFETIYATYNLHANVNGLYVGYELAEELASHLYREELFCRKGDAVKSYADASGIIGILYFRFGSREEAERYMYDMPRYLQVHVITITRLSDMARLTAAASPVTTGLQAGSADIARSEAKSASSGLSDETSMAGAYPAASENIHDEILRLGEHMTPPFSQRSQNGWSSGKYANKLAENAEIVTARTATGEAVGLIAAYMNRRESAFISMLVVSPLYRRHQIAKALCQNVHELARQRGIRCIRGEIRRENMACRTMAEARLGYTVKESADPDFVKVERML